MEVSKEEKEAKNKLATEKLRKTEQYLMEEYGQLFVLRANVAAINRMLIKRMQAEELNTELDKVIENFRENDDEREES